jgi:hypothetical protein
MRKTDSESQLSSLETIVLMYFSVAPIVTMLGATLPWLLWRDKTCPART